MERENTSPSVHPNKITGKVPGIRLLLVDDQRTLRQRLIGMLSGRPEVQVVDFLLDK